MISSKASSSIRFSYKKRFWLFLTIDIDVFFQGSHLAIPAAAKIASQPTLSETQLVNSSQLHQSRLGLLSQALMMIIATGFLFSETLEEFWKTKYVGNLFEMGKDISNVYYLCFRVNLTSRNTHDIVFRTIEIGIALWFPCVLWNCIRPEQLWCLNPKKILERFPQSLRDNTKSSNAGGGAFEAKNLRGKNHRNDSESSASSSSSEGNILT